LKFLLPDYLLVICWLAWVSAAFMADGLPSGYMSVKRIGPGKERKNFNRPKSFAFFRIVPQMDLHGGRQGV
jgi:hypothetical protein